MHPSPRANEQLDRFARGLSSASRNICSDLGRSLGQRAWLLWLRQARAVLGSSKSRARGYGPQHASLPCPCQFCAAL